MASPYAAYLASQTARQQSVEAVATQRIAASARRMRLASLAKLDRSFAEADLPIGTSVRVSLLVLSGVRRLLKSQLVGAPLPWYSTELFVVLGTQRKHGRTFYHIACSTCIGDADPRPALVNGVLAQLPRALRGVERRFLLVVPTDTVASMGRQFPAWMPTL
jgi:hypothetical protein